MTPFESEFLGTLVFVFLGCAVTANARLARTHGHAMGWFGISLGWAAALAAGTWVARTSGGMLNPALVLASVWDARVAMDRSLLWTYVGAEFAGAAVGAALAWLAFLPHWSRTDDREAILASFATVPAVRAPLSNLLVEAFASMVFVLVALAERGPDAWAIRGVAMLALMLGIGGTTQLALNPARDLMGRAVHALAPIPTKGRGDWGYAWVPFLGPILGAAAAVLVRRLLLSA